MRKRPLEDNAQCDWMILTEMRVPLPPVRPSFKEYNESHFHQVILKMVKIYKSEKGRHRPPRPPSREKSCRHQTS
jgi:hypothetical protein